MPRRRPYSTFLPSQINFLVPDGTAIGRAAVAVNRPARSLSRESANRGARTVQHEWSRDRRSRRDSPWPFTRAVLNCSRPSPYSSAPLRAAPPCPISLGVDRPVYVSFYGTGIRNRSTQANVTVTISGISLPVDFAGPSPDYPGLDQVNVALPLTLRGSGETQVVLTVDGPELEHSYD